MLRRQEAYRTTGKPVIIAFDAGNMVAVAERLAQKLPQNVPVVVAVDNDKLQNRIKSTTGGCFIGRSCHGNPARIYHDADTTISERQRVDEKGRPPLYRAISTICTNWPV